MTEKYPVNIWINDERYEKLQEAGLANMTEEVLAGMRVLKLQSTEEQKDEILKVYPMAKFDTATTQSIELLPSEVKDNMFDLIVKNKSLDIMEEFLKSVR